MIEAVMIGPFLKGFRTEHYYYLPVGGIKHNSILSLSFLGGKVKLGTRKRSWANKRCLP